MSNDRRHIWVISLSQQRLGRAARSFTTRRVPEDAVRTLVGGPVRPRSGDLVMACVQRLGQHTRLERPDGRRAAIHVGDEIVVTYGDRYATDQFEAEVPSTLRPTQLVASGGVAASVMSRSRSVRRATDIVPIGLLGDDRGRPLNIASFALPAVPAGLERPPTVAVLGTSMNSGKTTTVRYLVLTLSRAGLQPAATKVTGTGSGNDYWVMLDAGARRMLDFTDVGLSSTYRQPLATVERVFTDLVGLAGASETDVTFVEVADGIFQRETAPLIASEVFGSTVDRLVFAAGDAMGAAAGVSHLRSLGLNVVAVSGVLTRSPLAVREAESATGLPVLGAEELSDPDLVSELLGLPRRQPQTLPFVPEQTRWPVDLPGLDSTYAIEPAIREEDPSFLDEYFTWSDELADQPVRKLP